MKYTYLVKHHNLARVCAGMKINGGTLAGVSFRDEFEQLEKYETLLEDILSDKNYLSPEQRHRLKRQMIKLGLCE